MAEVYGRPVDEAPPPPQNPWIHRPPSFYAASELGPRNAKEEALCTKAATPDWLYMGSAATLFAASIFADSQYFKNQGEPNVFSGQRLAGPALVGLTWGAFIGSIYPSLPKCSPMWVHAAPLEGDTRSKWPLALSIAAAAGAIAPFVVATETGYRAGLWESWPVRERTARVVLPAITAFVGALIPYALPPRPLSAERELQRLRVQADLGRIELGYTVRF